MSWRQKTFEVLPALSVRRRDLRSSMRTVTAAWMFGIVWMAFVSGSQMVVFGRLLGFSDYDFGILAAIPFAATFAQLVASMIIERTGLRKYHFIFFACINRSLWLVIAAVPLLLRPGRAAVAAFMTVFAAYCVLAHLAEPNWLAWMGDLIPRRIRGRYFAARSRRALPIYVAATIAAGILLDRATAAGAPMTVQAQPVLLWTVCGIFVVAAVFGTIDALLFLRIREVVSPALTDRQASRRQPITLAGLAGALAEPLRIVVEAFRNRLFRHYALFGATITFAITVSGQFFWLNALENIGYTKLGANVVFVVFPAISSLMMVRLWGRLIDRWGRRPILILATAGIVSVPLVWIFMPVGNPTLAYVLGAAESFFVGGALWPAINLAQINVMLGFSETPGRSRYIAAAAVAVAVGGFTGGLVGGQIAQSLRGLPVHVGPFLLNNYHVTFLVSMAARAVAILWLIGMPDPRAKPLRDVVRHMWFNAYSNVMPRLFWPLRALSWRRGGENNNGRPDQDKGGE